MSEPVSKTSTIEQRYFSLLIHLSKESISDDKISTLLTTNVLTPALRGSRIDLWRVRRLKILISRLDAAKSALARAPVPGPDDDREAFVRANEEVARCEKALQSFKTKNAVLADEFERYTKAESRILEIQRTREQLNADTLRIDTLKTAVEAAEAELSEIVAKRRKMLADFQELKKY